MAVRAATCMLLGLHIGSVGCSLYEGRPGVFREFKVGQVVYRPDSDTLWMYLCVPSFLPRDAAIDRIAHEPEWQLQQLTGPWWAKDHSRITVVLSDLRKRDRPGILSFEVLQQGVVKQHVVLVISPPPLVAVLQDGHSTEARIGRLLSEEEHETTGSQEGLRGGSALGSSLTLLGAAPARLGRGEPADP
mgnify:CR=1 FL=1